MSDHDLAKAISLITTSLLATNKTQGHIIDALMADTTKNKAQSTNVESASKQLNLALDTIQPLIEFLEQLNERHHSPA